MSVEAITYVWQQSPYSGSTLIVHLAVADVVNDLHDNEFWSAIEPLAAKCNLNRRTVERALAQLVDDGWLTRLVDGKEKGQPSRYRFDIDGAEGTADRRTRVRQIAAPLRQIAAPPPIENSKELKGLFDAFYEAYPRHVGRAKAEQAFMRAVKRGTEPATIIYGARRFASDPNLPPPAEARFIPHPATWLNEGRWDDDPLPPRGAPRGGEIRVEDVPLPPEDDE